MPKGHRIPLKKFRAPPPRSNEEFDDDWSHVSEPVKLRRQKFVHEYIKDFNAANAMRRLGSKCAKPQIHGGEYFREPYTQWYLAKVMAEMEDKAIVTKNTILFGLLREANHHGVDGNSASRIAAFRALAKILGLEVHKLEGTMTLNGGVMTIPLAGTPDEWAKAATEAQKKLKLDVRK